MRWILVLVFALLFSRADATETWTFQSVVLKPTKPWEFTSQAPQGSVGEPKVIGPSSQCLIVAPPCLRMWFSGGWNNGAIGYAENADLTGQSPFTEYASNPIIGQGRLIGTAAHHTVVINGSSVCIAFSDSVSATPANLQITCSADGVTALPAPTKVLSPGAIDASLANPFLWQIGGRWHVLYEAQTTGGIWQLFQATTTVLVGPWSKLNSGQPSLALQVTGGAYSAPNVIVLNGVRNVWMHQSPQAGLVLPSAIYHTCEPVGIAGLQVANGGLPIISNRSGFDQAADPWPLDLNNVGTIFADEDNNSTAYTQISVWTTTGPLESLSCP